jgi:hypothetical protein
MAQHLVPLPAAPGADRAAAPAPQAVHVLGGDCGCSAAIARDLLARGPRPAWRESVVLLGTEAGLREDLERAGFAARTADPEEVAREQGIAGAPWLVLHFPDGRVAYSGGYARLRPGLPGYENLESDLMAAVARGEQPAGLRAYGCATSRSWRERLNPFLPPS